SPARQSATRLGPAPRSRKALMTPDTTMKQPSPLSSSSVAPRATIVSPAMYGRSVARAATHSSSARGATPVTRWAASRATRSGSDGVAMTEAYLRGVMDDIVDRMPSSPRYLVHRRQPSLQMRTHRFVGRQSNCHRESFCGFARSMRACEQMSLRGPIGLIAEHPLVLTERRHGVVEHRLRSFDLCQHYCAVERH